MTQKPAKDPSLAFDLLRMTINQIEEILADLSF